MTLPQDEVVSGLLAELRGLRGLVAPLTEDEWRAPTRCVGWTVFDVVAHVTGVMADITAGRLEGIDTQPWYDRQVDERRGRPPQALVEELDLVITATEELMTAIDEAAWNGPARSRHCGNARRQPFCPSGVASTSTARTSSPRSAALPRTGRVFRRLSPTSRLS